MSQDGAQPGRDGLLRRPLIPRVQHEHRLTIETLFDSGHVEPTLADGVDTQARAGDMALNPILTHLAMVLLQKAVDTSEDDAGEHIAELRFALPKKVNGGSCLARVEHLERAHLRR